MIINYIFNGMLVLLGIFAIFLVIVMYYQYKKKEFNWDLPLTPNMGLIINFDGEKTVNIGLYKIK